MKEDDTIKMWYLDDKLYHIGGPAIEYDSYRKWAIKCSFKKKKKRFKGLDKKLFELED